MFPQPYPLKGRHFRLVKSLVDHGANVNHIDKGGQTPLHFAAYSGRMKVVMHLLQNGATVTRDLEFLSLKTDTPMDNAIEFPNVLRMLTLKSEVEIRDRKELREEHKRQQLAVSEEIAIYQRWHCPTPSIAAAPPYHATLLPPILYFREKWKNMPTPASLSVRPPASSSALSLTRGVPSKFSQHIIKPTGWGVWI